MTTLKAHYIAHITAKTYQEDKYREGFVLQVIDDASGKVLEEVPLKYVGTDKDTDIYAADVEIEEREQKLLFDIVFKDKDIHLKTKTPIRSKASEQTKPIYSGPNTVGEVAVTTEVLQPASRGASSLPSGSPGAHKFEPVARITEPRGLDDDGLAKEIRIRPDLAKNIASPQISLRRPDLEPSDDQSFWVAIRDRSNAIGFNNYKTFIDDVLCASDGEGGVSTGRNAEGCNPEETRIARQSVEAARKSLRTHMGSVDAYKLLEVATEAFLLMHCGVYIDDDAYSATSEASRLSDTVTYEDIKDQLIGYLAKGGGNLPYLDQIIRNLSLSKNEPDLCGNGFMEGRVSCPCLMELIWSYWHEEGMLVQTINAISGRFQNRRLSDRGGLANLEIDPLRPLNNLLWGFIQDEMHRLSVVRRAYEYDHHYGLRLVGKAVPSLKTADSRSKFIEAFHSLLHQAALFYQEDADLNVVSDGFQLLNALREVHLILAYGAHNQFGDLPWTARKEMLIMQWLLARPEMRGFLGGRAMVPYAEGWMAQVDSMKQLQKWTDTSITHFRDLGVYGEQLLLSIRYGNWSDVNDQNQAKNWARYWRPEVQSYIYAYKAATGVDLSADVVSTERAKARYLRPSVHLQRQLNKQTNKQGLGKPAGATTRSNGRG